MHKSPWVGGFSVISHQQCHHCSCVTPVLWGAYQSQHQPAGLWRQGPTQKAEMFSAQVGVSAQVVQAFGFLILYLNRAHQYGLAKALQTPGCGDRGHGFSGPAPSSPAACLAPRLQTIFWSRPQTTHPGCGEHVRTGQV